MENGRIFTVVQRRLLVVNHYTMQEKQHADPIKLIKVMWDVACIALNNAS